MTRRTLLECAVRLAALPAGAQFFSSWVQAGQTGQHVHSRAPQDEAFNASRYEPAFFPPEDFQALRAMTALLIPTDDMPGAQEAHCAEFIDFVLAGSQDLMPEIAKQWRAAMKALRTAGFHQGDAGRRSQLLADMAKPEAEPSADHPAFSAYRLIKRETVFAFFTSRAGIIDNLDYRGNSYNLTFPACTHPEHHEI